MARARGRGEHGNTGGAGAPRAFRRSRPCRGATPTCSPAPWACPPIRWTRPGRCSRRSPKAGTASIGLGLAGDRYFTFNAGLGLDAEVVRAVDGHRARGRAATSVLYLRMILRQFYRVTDRRHPALTLERDGHPPAGPLFLGIVSNTAPWTYLGRRPAYTNRQAAFDCGLDLFALRSLGTVSMLRTVSHLLSATYGRARAQRPDPARPGRADAEIGPAGRLPARRRVRGRAGERQVPVRARCVADRRLAASLAPGGCWRRPLGVSGRSRRCDHPGPRCDPSDIEIRRTFAQDSCGSQPIFERVKGLLASGAPAMRPCWAGYVVP